jgi:hypothetical protein
LATWSKVFDDELNMLRPLAPGTDPAANIYAIAKRGGEAPHSKQNAAE